MPLFSCHHTLPLTVTIVLPFCRLILSGMFQYSIFAMIFLWARHSINVGDTLIVELPYAAVLLPSYSATHCHHCFAILPVNPVGMFQYTIFAMIFIG